MTHKDVPISTGPINHNLALKQDDSGNVRYANAFSMTKDAYANPSAPGFDCQNHGNGSTVTAPTVYINTDVIAGGYGDVLAATNKGIK